MTHLSIPSKCLELTVVLNMSSEKQCWVFKNPLKSFALKALESKVENSTQSSISSLIQNRKPWLSLLEIPQWFVYFLLLKTSCLLDWLSNTEYLLSFLHSLLALIIHIAVTPDIVVSWIITWALVIANFEFIQKIAAYHSLCCSTPGLFTLQAINSSLLMLKLLFFVKLMKSPLKMFTVAFFSCTK